MCMLCTMSHLQLKEKRIHPHINVSGCGFTPIVTSSVNLYKVAGSHVFCVTSLGIFRGFGQLRSCD